MPYTPKSYPVRWIDLPEAFEHIQECDNVSLDQAWGELSSAIAHGDVEAILRLHSPSGRFAVQFERPAPRGMEFWAMAALIKGDPFIVMAVEEIGSRYRSDEKWEVFVSFGDVLQIWPLTEAQWNRWTPNGESWDEGTSASEPTSAARQVITTEQIRSAAKTVYANNLDDPPNIDRAERAIRELLGSGSRKLIREVLNEPEFASARRPAGNQPKR